MKSEFANRSAGVPPVVVVVDNSVARTVAGAERLPTVAKEVQDPPNGSRPGVVDVRVDDFLIPGRARD